MALPIVGKFFHKTYRDPKFTPLKNARFPDPEPELLAQLNEPQYREMLDLKTRILDFADIFKGDDKKDDLKERKQQERENSQKKGNFWSKIKGIFK